MPTDRQQAAQEFRRIVKWIATAAVLMVVGALSYLAMAGELRPHMAIATILGVFFSVLLGCGLFALAFFSDKSGHDESVGRATTSREKDVKPETRP